MSYKTGKRIRLLSDEMKLYVIKRYNGKSLDEHFPKNKKEKIDIKCVDCDCVYKSNNYDFIDKFPNNRCSSCVQKYRWKYDYDRLCAVRRTDEYRRNMKESIKRSKRCNEEMYKENGRKHTEYWANIRGFTKEELWDEWKLYKKIVVNMTERVYRKYKSELNPDNLPRQHNHLDHKFSILEGFRRKIPPYIISDKCNLQIIPKIDNLRKGYDCVITEDELIEMVYKEGRFNSENL